MTGTKKMQISEKNGIVKAIIRLLRLLLGY